MEVVPHGHGQNDAHEASEGNPHDQIHLSKNPRPSAPEREHNRQKNNERCNDPGNQRGPHRMEPESEEEQGQCLPEGVAKQIPGGNSDDDVWADPMKQGAHIPWV
jgi:hypothetical protein